MRAFIFTLLSVFFINAAFGQAQKTFVKSFPQVTSNLVVLNLDGEVEVKEWAEPFLRVHTNVMLDNASSEVLKVFLMQGRYNLQAGTQDGAMTITSSNRDKNVKYRGHALGETVTYTVFVPQYTEVKIIGEDGSVTSSETSK